MTFLLQQGPPHSLLEDHVTSCFDPFNNVLYVRNGGSWDEIEGMRAASHDAPEGLTINQIAIGRDPCICGYMGITKYVGYMAFPNTVVDEDGVRFPTDFVFIKENRND